jgi:hypothetical protein
MPHIGPHPEEFFAYLEGVGYTFSKHGTYSAVLHRGPSADTNSPLLGLSRWRGTSWAIAPHGHNVQLEYVDAILELLNSNVVLLLFRPPRAPEDRYRNGYRSS